MSDDYSTIFTELQTSLTDYIDKQHKDMEKNIENYRKRLLLQFNSKKEKAGKEREALWNIICSINADNSLNNHKKIVFDPIMEVSDSLQSYHQQRSPYPIGSYTNNTRRFSDTNQFFTYHSYKMSSMASYAHNRADIRPDTKNVFDIVALKKELDKAENSEITDTIEEEKESEIVDNEGNVKDEDENKKKDNSSNNETEGDTHILSSSQVSKELNDNIEKIDISNDNLLNENKDSTTDKTDKTDKIYDDIFLLDGIDDENNKEKYIPDEELDEEYDQVNDLVNISSRYNQHNNLSIYATSVPINIPERPKPVNNDDSSPDKDNSDKEFTPPHIIIARTYQNDEAMMHPNHANKYFSVAY